MLTVKTMRLAVWTSLLASILWLGGCQGATPIPASTPAPTDTPAPTATSTPAPTATSTAAPTATPAAPETGAPGDWSAFVDESRGLTLTHPADWTVYPGGELDLPTLLAQLDGTMSDPEAAALLQQFAAPSQAQDFLVAVGFLFGDPNIADRRFVSNFNLLYLPAEGLGLDVYARMVAVQLDALEHIQVQDADVVAGLRPEGLEAATLRYTVDGALYQLPSGVTLEGWQIAFFDPQAQHLAVLSFVTVAEDFPALEPIFRAMVQRFTFR